MNMLERCVEYPTEELGRGLSEGAEVLGSGVNDSLSVDNVCLSVVEP